MNAYSALQNLRKTRDVRYQHAALCDVVKEQLEQILALQKQKDMLDQRLSNLTSGQTVEELNQWDNRELTERSQVLRELKEKLAAYRLIGPCGLTVSDIDTSSLVITFTPMWHTFSEVFYIRLIEKGDGLQVSATNIPYFFHLPALVANMKADKAELLNAISLKLKAYVQRKAELQLALTKHADVITSSFQTEPATYVDIQLQSLDTPTEILKQLGVYITYSNVDDILPSKVKFSPKNILFPSEVEEELSQLMLNSPLNSALAKVVDYLLSTGAHVELPVSADEEFVND